MRTFSTLWQAYRADTTPSWYYDIKCLIDSVEYTGAEIFGFGKSGGLISDDFSLGNCVSQAFSITVSEKSGVTIPKNAKVEPYVRITGDAGDTAWYRLGVYYIDTRARLDGGKLKFGCYDRMLFADVPFLTGGETLGDYPMPMDTAMTRIYTALGCTLDARCTISHTLTIEYPNDMTMRQVLGMIASAHGGNFCITDEDYLRLVIPGYGSVIAAIDGSNATATIKGTEAITYDSVAMIYTDDGAYLESGVTKLQTLDITNYWATQAMCDAVRGVIAGFTYTPYTANAADLDPAIELGDHITIDGVNCNVWTWAWNNRLYCDITVPGSSDTTTSEFGYTGTLTQAIAKKVTLGASYFGTSISRASGIKIARSDGSSEAIFNSTVFAMRALVNGTMTDKIYFDPVKGAYVFDGELSADVINALSALISPNFYAGKATISELTVDELDTSDKVQNYLNSLTADVNYQRIYDQYHKYITATTNGATYAQALNRDGELLYWVDETHTAATTEETDFPVYVYEYTEATKLEIAFEYDGTYYTPKIILGAGTGVNDNGKAKIYKDTTGFYIDYFSSVAGTQYTFKITDDGIDFSGFPSITYTDNTVLNGLIQVWVGTASEIAAVPVKVKDVVVVTDDPTRYDCTVLTASSSPTVFDSEILYVSGTSTITLPSTTFSGVIKKIYNTGTGIVTLSGTINGIANMVLFPGESVELSSNGSGWRIC
jgi:hypothetical protein